MPNWKKVITSGSNAELNQITASGAQIQNIKAQQLQDTTLTSGRVTFATTNGVLTDSNILTFNGSKLSSTFLEAQRSSVINESGHSTGNFRVEGGGNTHLLFTDASEDTVGIKNSSPSASLDITGDLQTTSHITASGNISSSGTINADSYLSNGLKLWKRSSTTGIISSGQGGDASIKVNNITSSGDISSSGGNIFSADKFKSQGVDVIDGGSTTRIGAFQGNNVLRGNSISTEGYLNVTSNITASGNISSSGNLIGNTLVIGGGTFTSASLAAGGSGGSTNAAGSDTQVQFNDGGTNFGGDSGLVFNKTSNLLTAGAITVTGNITANGNIAGDNSTNISGIADITTLGDSSFGNTDSDTHLFAGHITASGFISASGYGKGGIVEISDINSTVGRISVDSAAASGNSGLHFNVDGTDKIQIRKANLSTQFQSDIETFGGEIFFASASGHITASGNISASGNAQVNQITASSFQFVGSGNAELEVQGHITASGNISASGNFIGSTRFDITGTTDAQHQGDVVFLGNTTTNNGKIYHYKSNGSWEIADADAASTSDGLLAVALGSNSTTNGMLLRGMVTLDHDPGTTGDVLFLQTGSSGHATSIAPSGNNDIARVVGYYLGIDDGQIWFNPDNTFVEISV